MEGMQLTDGWQQGKGDVIMFAIDPDGNDSYDGGRLSVTIEAIE